MNINDNYGKIEIDLDNYGKYKDIKLNNINEYYLVVCNNKKLNKYTIVKYITCSYSGNCYLVEDILSNNKEWLMYYDLYPLDWNSHNFKYQWFYNNSNEKIIKKLFE